MKCPGQDTQFWNQDAIFETTCPECDQPMEFFKDDATRRCPGCQKKIVNPKMDFGCASYCQFAEECLGSLPEEFVAARQDLFKDRLAVEVKKFLGTDFKHISHTIKTANFAETIAKEEKARLPVVLCAAYLYDIAGTKNGENDNKSDTSSTDPESVKIASTLMEKLGADEQLTQDVLDLVGQHARPADDEIIERKILHDADMLAHMVRCEGKNGVDNDQLKNKLNKLFLTRGGKELAATQLLK